MRSTSGYRSPDGIWSATRFTVTAVDPRYPTHYMTRLRTDDLASAVGACERARGEGLEAWIYDATTGKTVTRGQVRAQLVAA
jgi:hypothetical protein